MNLRLSSTFLAAAACGFAFAGSYILAPNPANKRVVLLSAFDGSIVNADYISMPTASSGFAIREALPVGDKIWVSHQVANKIEIYDRKGVLLDTITTISAPTGMDLIDGSVFVCSNATLKNVYKLDTAGNILSSFPATESVFDVMKHNGELLVTHYNASQTVGNNFSAIFRYSLAGAPLGAFFTGLRGPMQMHKRANGNILTATFVDTSEFNSGVFEVSPTGVLISGPVNPFAAAWACRGTFELGNGRYLFTKADGAFSVDRTNDETFQVVPGSCHFLTPFDVPEVIINGSNPNLGGTDRDQIMDLQIRQPGSGTVLYSTSFNMGNQPSWASVQDMLSVDAGTYDVALRASGTLWKVFKNQVFSQSATLTFSPVFVPGDIVRDNVIDLSDYTEVAVNFNKLNSGGDWLIPGSSGYSPSESDLNNDGVVDLTDYTTIAVNFNQLGE